VKHYLLNINASPHPYGNSIALRWENAEPDLYPWVRIVRRERTYPISPDDGNIVAEKSAIIFETGTSAISDLDNNAISSELLQLFVTAGIILSPRVVVEIEEPSTKWLITNGELVCTLRRIDDSIIAYKKGAFSFVDKKLRSETVYYYALFPFKKNPLEYVIDSANHTAAMATGAYDTAGQMYDLLPRIYYRYDTAVSHKVSAIDKQKGELRRLLDIPGSQLDQLYSFAKAALDLHNVEKIDGRLLPLLAQWIGWQTDYRNEIGLQRNEIRNAPFIYQTTGLIPNVEAAVKRISGWECRTKEYVHNVFLTNNPEKLNLWLKEKSGPDKWSEPTAPLSLDYAYEGRPAAVQDADGKCWLFYNTYRERLVKKDKTRRTVCNIWCKTCDENGWSPSEPLTDRIGIDKHPSAALHDGNLWLFWSVYDEQAGIWHLEYQIRSGEAWNPVWSPGQPDYEKPFGNIPVERKRPLAVADDSGGLWLFWLEKNSRKWQMKYNRHDGCNWQLLSPAIFPLQDESMEDPFVLFDGGTNSIYIFWVQRDGDGKSKILAYLRKNSIDPNLTDWDATYRPVHRDPGQYDDREPSAIVADGKIDLFWSSNRSGNWSVWRNTLTPATDTWETTEQMTEGPYSQRDPLPLALNGKMTFIYRSNQTTTCTSRIYKATETTDFRYAGSTTVDMNNTSKNELYKQFEDFQTYIYDTGKDDDDCYARDRVGMYLQAGTGDPGLISRNQGIIRQLLIEIMPIQVKPVFNIETIYVETYDFPCADQYSDRLTASIVENYSGAQDVHEDAIPEWIRLHTVDSVTDVTPRRYADHHSVNFESPTPPDTKYRTWHTGLKEEE
jgi:hypothetical protein